MALRAFHCNPAIGGFGNETETNLFHDPGRISGHGDDGDAIHGDSHGNGTGNGRSDGDAFAQIVKELVDNAVDACSFHSNDNNDSNKSSRIVSSDGNETVVNKKNGGNVYVSNQRVRVTLESVQRSRDDNANQSKTKWGTHTDAHTDTHTHTDTAERKQLLRLTICDNGCGMKDIETCVSAFSSTKHHNHCSTHPSISTSQPQSQPQSQMQDTTTGKQTAGRYGIGLTLCLLHAQRLVPNSCAMIKSTITNASTWTVAKFVVDTNRDSVVCVEKHVMRKKDVRMSGTAVSLLLPGGREAQRAWPRLAEYFARFQLSLGLTCSLEVLAPSLSRLPLFIRPAHELEQMLLRKERRDCGSGHTRRNRGDKNGNDIDIHEDGDAVKEIVSASVANHQNAKGNNDNDEGTNPHSRNAIPATTLTFNTDGENCEPFIDLLDEPNICTNAETVTDELGDEPTSIADKIHQSTAASTSPHKEDQEEWHLELDEDFFASTSLRKRRQSNTRKEQEGTNNDNIVPSTTILMTKAQKRQEDARKRRVQMQQSISSYLKKPIELMNVAHSHQKIRRHSVNNTSSNPLSKETPSLEVDVIVSECDEDNDEVEGTTIRDHNSTPLPQDHAEIDPNHDRSKAKMMLIRMVNRIPMLDGAEASACGVVTGLQQKSLWNSFGLDISSMSSCSSSNSIPTPSLHQALHVPTFSLADSAHIAPFFSQTHELFTDNVLTDDEDNDINSDGDDDDDDDIEDMAEYGRKRKRNRKSLFLKPAGLRLGNVIVIVQLNAKSSQLPLPTLSKGRLPMNDSAINVALQAGLNSCLRDLQKTNPSLLLTSSQLKRTEREVLYTPAIASALSSMIINCSDSELKEKWTSQFPNQVDISKGDQAETDQHEDSDFDLRLQSQMTYSLGERIRASLLHHEKERQRESKEKEKLRRKVRSKSKPSRKRSDGNESSSSCSQYDLENLMNQEDDKNIVGGFIEEHSLSKVDKDVSPLHEEDDMKSIFSSESIPQTKGGSSICSSTSKESNSVKDIGDTSDENSMKSTFSHQSSPSRSIALKMTNANKNDNERCDNDDDFDDDEWW